MTRRSGSHPLLAAIAAAVVMYSPMVSTPASAAPRAPHAGASASVLLGGVPPHRTPIEAPATSGPTSLIPTPLQPDPLDAWWPRPTSRACPPPRVRAPITGGQALRLSVLTTVVPTAIGVSLLREAPRGVLDPRELLGGALVGFGLIAGPSEGYVAGGLSNRGALTAGIRLAGLAMVVHEGGRTADRLERGGGAVMVVGASIYDFVHVADDVERHRNGWTIGAVPPAPGEPLALTLRHAF